MFLKNLWHNTDAIGWLGGFFSQYLGLFAFEIIGDLITANVLGWMGIGVEIVGDLITGIVIGFIVNFVSAVATWVKGFFKVIQDIFG